MFEWLKIELDNNPLYYGIVLGPFLFLCSFLAYDAIYMLLLELWCIAYGLIY
tara:strand:- start:4831 stop:4986 length:156 start_codon:yes stop_codon:yes gene_type:complete